MQTTHYNRIAIIQSLPEHEQSTGTRLFEDISSINDAHALELDIKLYNIKSKNEFLNLLLILANEAKTYNLLPILHIEAHGNQKGLVFASDELITWAEVKTPLTELNIQTKNNLFVTLAACKGAHLIETLELTDIAPCCGLVGPTIDITVQDLKSYYNFYLELLTKGNGDDAIKLLMDSCPFTYYFTSAELFFKQVFKKYLEERSTKQALKQAALRVHKKCKEKMGQEKIPNRMSITKRQLANTESAFRKYKKKFLMLDLYPENKERFTLKYKDLKK